MVLNTCMKFYEHILNHYRADMILSQKLLLTNSKVLIQELWFLYSACRLMLVNICMKFYEDTLNGFKVIEETNFKGM